jgi:hypothetical protein
MHQEHIKSPAFQNAELHSERLRIFGVLGFMTIVVIVTVVRVFVIHTAAATSLGVDFVLLRSLWL